MLAVDRLRAAARERDDAAYALAMAAAVLMLLGIGMLGFAQIALVAAVAVGFLLSRATVVPPSLASSAALVVPWFALGFALYAVGYAAAGALVTRQEDAQAATLPITVVMIVSPPPHSPLVEARPRTVGPLWR